MKAKLSTFEKQYEQDADCCDPKSVRSVIMAPLRENSRKPDEAYAAAEALMPRGRKADVFTRERRSGWESFGDEVGKFNQGEAP